MLAVLENRSTECLNRYFSVECSPGACWRIRCPGATRVSGYHGANPRHRVALEQR